jgi:hypothetical protein
MEEANENGTESLHSAHANGMNEMNYHCTRILTATTGFRQQ